MAGLEFIFLIAFSAISAAAHDIGSNVIVPVSSTTSTVPFYVIAHMANNAAALDYAIAAGANAIENDLRFDAVNGVPIEFRHGGICDCSASSLLSKEMCVPLGNDCEARNDAIAHVEHAASLKGLHLYMIDSKVSDSMSDELLRNSGLQVVKLLDQHLFAKGYKGDVIVGCGKFATQIYLSAAIEAAELSPNKQRYFFSIDQQSNDYDTTIKQLTQMTMNRVYGTGITSLVDLSFRKGIKAAVEGGSHGHNGFTYIWTIDSGNNMEDYIDLGIGGVMTNDPRELHQLAISKGLTLAESDDHLRPSITGPSDIVCDCDYKGNGLFRQGGCKISFPSPPGFACECHYKGFWTCGGRVKACDPSSDGCRRRDLSKESCTFGGGDCSGYL